MPHEYLANKVMHESVANRSLIAAIAEIAERCERRTFGGIISYWFSDGSRIWRHRNKSVLHACPPNTAP